MYEGNAKEGLETSASDPAVSPAAKPSVRRTPSTKGRTKKNGKNGFWKRQARTWHWISGAVCLIGMLLFSVTGITLNHAGEIPADPVTTEQAFTLDATSIDLLTHEPLNGTAEKLPTRVMAEISRNLGISVQGRPVEWTEVDAYIALPRPGGDAWLSIDRETGEVVYELTTRGAIAYLNDLHKGRNTGTAWAWFIDIFSVASILFCLTGLWLLQIHAGKRPSTWPLTILGFLLPALLALFFIH
jgi:hypothetical protein